MARASARMLTVSILLFMFLCFLSTSAFAWWDPSWSYRAKVVITNPSTESLTNYNVLVTVDTATLISAGKMRSDCGDMRFVDSDDSTPLKYWIQEGCGTTSTRVWVQLPSISPSSTRNIYLYYGNPTATSESNIDIWPNVRIKVSTSLGYLYICGSPASKNTWVNCRIYPGASDTPIILTMGSCYGWHRSTWYSPCDRFQVIRKCDDASDCYFYTTGCDYGSPSTTVDIDTGSYKSMFELECYTPGTKSCSFSGFSCQWNGNVAHAYRYISCGCVCCDCCPNAIRRLAIHRANPEVTATVKPEESMVKCYTAFYDDFSQNPETSGKWSIRRAASDPSSEISWDSTNKRVYLTRAVRNRAGAMFANYALTSHKWRARFRYLAGGGSGADGFAFHFYTNPLGYRPGKGGALGYDPSKGGYAISFDNYYNSGCDPSERHIALTTSSECTELAYKNTGVTEDNKWHQVVVEYDEGHVTVTVDGTKMMDYTIQNPDYTYAGVGFSAATGGYNNNHIIDDFYLEVPSDSCCSNGELDYGEITVDCGPACSFYEAREATCSDNKDNDCDGLVDCKDPDCGVDNDGDGYYGTGPCAVQPDCDDNNPFVNPGIEERSETRFVLGGTTFYVPVFTGSQTSQDYYGYSSWSTTNTNLERSNTLTLGLYQEESNPDVAYLVLVADKRNDGSGGSLSISMTPTSASAVVKDDPVKDDPQDKYNPSAGTYTWGWGSCCTDGMVLGPLSPGTGLSWRVVSSSGLSNARVFGESDTGGYYYTSLVSFSDVKSSDSNLIGPVLACQDGIDNDCDGRVDDEDPGCVDISRAGDYSCDGTRTKGDLDSDGDIDDDDMSIIRAIVAAGVPQGKEQCCADLDGDGDVDSNDAFLLQEYVEGRSSCFPAGYSCDVMELCSDNKDNDCDSSVDFDDPDCVTPIKAYDCNAGCQRRGDTNNDGNVDFDDVRALSKAIRDDAITDANYCCGDLNGDFMVEKTDVSLLEEYVLGERTCFPAGYYCYQRENCHNSVDDDCNGYTDTNDPECQGACLSSVECSSTEYCAAPSWCDGTGRCKPDVGEGGECGTKYVLVENETGSMCTTNLCVLDSPGVYRCVASCKSMDGEPCYQYSNPTGAYTLGVCAYNNQGSPRLSSSWSCTPDGVCKVDPRDPYYQYAVVSSACYPGNLCDMDTSDQKIDLNWQVSSSLECTYQCDINMLESVPDCDGDGTVACSGESTDRIVFTSTDISGQSCPDTVYLSAEYRDATGKCDVVYNTTCELNATTGSYDCASAPIEYIPYGCGGETAEIYKAWIYYSPARDSSSLMSSTTTQLSGDITYDTYGVTVSTVCGDGVVGVGEECDPPTSGHRSVFCPYIEGKCDRSARVYYKYSNPTGSCNSSCKCDYGTYTIITDADPDDLYCKRCVTEHCSDGVKNCGEFDVDKGGACGAWCDIVVDPSFVEKVLKHYALFPQSKVLTLQEVALVLKWYRDPSSCTSLAAKGIVEKVQGARFFDVL